MNFDQAPMLVIWEATQACDLACVHCRASAQPERSATELTTEQGYRLLDEIRSFGEPLMVFTGGDPLKRPDLFDLIRYSVKIGLRTNVTPSATPLLTAEAIDKFKEAGVSRMAISVDGHDAASHDDFRGIPGTFDRAMFALRPRPRYRPRHPVPNHGDAAQYGPPARDRRYRHRDEIQDVEPVLPDRDRPRAGQRRPARQRVRRGLRVHVRALEDRPVRHQDHRGHALSPLRRAAHQAEHGATENEAAKGVAFRTAGVSDGKGFVFVSHQGEIFPSGFLPVSGGNVLNESLTDVYRNSDLFKTLRDTTQREGKCGICEYQKICGGSRARAYALTGDFLAEDPRCTYQPHLADAIAG